MPPDTPAPGSPEAWLRHAQSDLALAAVAPPAGVLLEGLCFHAQQAAEKAVKAVLVSVRIPPPHTHSIGALLDLVPASLNVPAEVQEAAILTDYAVLARYPSNAESVSADEYRHALHVAEVVVRWAEVAIGREST